MRTERSRLASSADEVLGVLKIWFGGVSSLFGVELLLHKLLAFDEAMMVILELECARAVF